jgi:signal transduction histidine kinase
MASVLEGVVGALRFQIQEAGAEVKLGLLPPCLADAVSVGQIFSNLLDNALKYRDPRRPLVVNISGEPGPGRVVYRVADNGQGIGAADLPGLWDISFKPGRAATGGEGIGLPMVKRAAQKNGGGVRVECKEGLGCDFYIELPAWRE